MSSKTKIVVLHMKELIYTGIFVALGILFIVLMILMFLPKKDSSGQSPGAGAPAVSDDKGGADEGQSSGENVSGKAASNGQSSGEDARKNSSSNTRNGREQTVSSDQVYIPGIYTTQLILNDQAIDVEVIVDAKNITSLSLVNLNETITTMYPLLEPAFESLREQIYEKQTLEDITYESESKYTSLVLLTAIRNSLDKAYAAAENPE